ncbi:hypothetical protein C1646_716193 [Rhizophagus diaphanus]|nr:hypothetical protein C1646_716193 [Rhizophagus diaphanus] [Rhizophagus sp. MUCL 43196]
MDFRNWKILNWNRYDNLTFYNFIDYFKINLYSFNVPQLNRIPRELCNEIKIN